MYASTNFKTKKALREAVASGQKITCYQPGPFGSPPRPHQTVFLEGPHFPEPHRWYAKCVLDENCYICKVI